MKRSRYLGFSHKVGGKPQIQVLHDYADDKKATPLYCLYNYSNMADPEKHWHCCQRPFRQEELGCSIAPASRVSDAIHTWGKRSFEFIHECDQTLPWQCLASCPKVREALAQAQKNPTVSPFPLFDRRSYHPELPPFLAGPSQVWFGEVGLVSFEDGEWSDDDLAGYNLEIIDFDATEAQYFQQQRESLSAVRQLRTVSLPGTVYVTDIDG